MVGAAPNWSYLWCEVKAGIMKGWRSPEDSNKEPQLTIDVLPKVSFDSLRRVGQPNYQTDYSLCLVLDPNFFCRVT